MHENAIFSPRRGGGRTLYAGFATSHHDPRPRPRDNFQGERVNIALRRFLHNHGNIATEGGSKSGLCPTLIIIDKGSSVIFQGSSLPEHSDFVLQYWFSCVAVYHAYYRY